MKDEHAKKNAAGLPAARTPTSERQSMERAALLALSFGQATAFRHAYDPPTPHGITPAYPPMPMQPKCCQAS